MKDVARTREAYRLVKAGVAAGVVGAASWGLGPALYKQRLADARERKMAHKQHDDDPDGSATGDGGHSLSGGGEGSPTLKMDLDPELLFYGSIAMLVVPGITAALIRTSSPQRAVAV